MLSLIRHIVGQPNIAVDLGTANTRVYAPESDRFTEEPSKVSQIDRRRAEVIGDEYIAYLNSKLFFAPLRGGVVVDVDRAANLLRPLVKKSKSGFRQPVTLACAPTDTSEKERGLLAKALLNAGASRVAIIPEVWAAAMGAGLDVHDHAAQALIDIGHGVSDLAVIAGGRLIGASAVRTACGDLQKAVRLAVIQRRKVYLYASDVERLTHELTALSEPGRPERKLMSFNGMDIIKRRKVAVELGSDEIVAAMEPVVNRIIKMIQQSLRGLAPEIRRDVTAAGLCLTGGGACVKGMDRLIAQRTGLTVRVAANPIHSVINGAGKALAAWKQQQNWWDNVAWPRHLS
ncbi:cell shape determining protein MreB/Mrl [Desulfarculus baarsii DSM 2075]|uniref:Cell shape determining protein MreB/Mrl n=1 Tax=Desulfarculus baarsii (strain ATCC 33931 / DSM 2075 / LMG 7858 / VKM B-1802 / 2st14) TaxID=644282 RepID=E1QJ09_DESB2|nr:rod shape-determining protein [Desulfarculus baarsii]ADK85552.1 cell shape determining protein MreB/Mrl [Desulfarculus baarsii DSM 2075]